MYEVVNFTDFNNRFLSMNREGHYSRKGREALFEYLEQLEEGIETRIELDVIGICCDYTEYKNFEQFKENYTNDNITSINDISNYTTVINIPDTERFIIQNY